MNGLYGLIYNGLYGLIYDERVVKKDIPRLSKTIRHRIKTAIEQKLQTDPIHFGKPLRYSRTGQRRLRVGDYRVLYIVDDETRTVSIFSIQHRKDVYG